MSAELEVRADGWTPSPARHGGPADATTKLTDEMREAFLALTRADPSLGHVRAARQVGVVGSRGQIHRLLDNDEGLIEAAAEDHAAMLHRAGLSRPNLLERLVHVANDDGNSSQLRAIQFGLALLGLRADETIKVEHTADIDVHVLHERRLTLDDVAEFAGRLEGLGGGARGELSAVGAVLPASADD